VRYAGLTGSPDAQWYRQRTADAPSTLKTLIVALARNLLISFWRLARDGVVLAGVLPRPAASSQVSYGFASVRRGVMRSQFEVVGSHSAYGCNAGLKNGSELRRRCACMHQAAFTLHLQHRRGTVQNQRRVRRMLTLRVAE
jgi:hypothetical protein